ncbi:unnamed protein product [Oppiella nova]|uniref:CUB domain-containing protein n=1 Tax=Oppiella nova TaxID=334625 RepID=A0A7R9QCA9_9ACAR|nr:unnamed protein product [Oppiella nova]CAG2162077.1 unnamed protein product [Oppiella nova]
MNCEWKIRVPKNHTIILQFIDFKTEDTDHLTISDYTISGYSGHQLPPNLYSASNALTLTFKTDMSVTDRGFKIAYKAKELDPNVTFLASAYNVLIKLNSSDVKTIAMNGDIMSGLMDYNIKDDRIVWFDPQKHKFILKSIESTVDMSDEIDVVGQPNSLLLDWVHDLLYWLDIKSKTIKTENPRDLVINVVKGVLVWSNIGFEANLMQTHLDGSNQSVLYGNNRQAFHLTVDYQTQRYYFIDINDHSLYSIDFDGNNETFILKSKELFDPIISIQFFMTNTIDIDRREFTNRNWI